MNIFVDKTQFILFPAFGFVNDAGELFFTVAFMWYGISFLICHISEND